MPQDDPETISEMAVSLLKIWEAMTSRASPEKLLPLAEQALKQGEILLAQEILRKAREHFSSITERSASPLQLEIEERYLLCLASLGNSRVVASRVDALLREGVATENLYGLAARCCKDLYHQTGDIRHLEEAFKQYHEGFLNLSKKSYYLGVNAASCAAVLQKSELSDHLARNVLGLVPMGSDMAPWEWATRGECHLVLHEIAEARKAYSKAATLAHDDLMTRASMRKQARWLLGHLGLGKDEFDGCFNIGPLLVFAGHLPDLSERSEIRFPAASQEVVRRAMNDLLDRLKPGMAYLSAAAGADLLMLDCLQQRKIPYHLVLPCPPKDFCALSVSPYGREWLEPFEVALSHAESFRQSSHREAPLTGMAWIFASQCLSGFALLHAKSSALDLVPVVVWNNEDGVAGGTGSFVRFWRGRGCALQQIHPLSGEQSTLDPQAVPPADEGEQTTPEPGGGIGQVIRAMVFADVKGYTSLGDRQVPPFISNFMGLVAEALESGASAPLSVNTWGDAVYVVFDTPAHAGNFSVELMQKIGRMDWEKEGLPRDITFRISCHAGPVFEATDPVTRRKSFYGTHVSQTARIEPITPPGMIYASEEFAALAMMDPEARFSAEYIGHLPLAKGFGNLRIYHLRALL
jgi:class 3 adenylate cyclase/tetratricopeptide (TPR) repeat protein